MPHQNYLSLFVLLASVIYYLYLLDPFRGKPLKRNYKKILNDFGFFLLNLCIAILFSAVGILSILFREDERGSVGFTMSPLFFIVSVKAVNAYSRKYYNRDFFLLLRGDIVKSSSFSDVLSSVIVLVFSLFLSPIVLFFIQSKKS
jgi:hypothetical protein